ncbi:MAG: thioesterase family protein [Proteobacteria bacterium]|nr:thioesterase family protein [Pseudomonadota bacterium]
MPDSIPAPFLSSVMAIEPAWIDYNGHLNVAYYNVLFDRAIDEFYLPLGLGPDYLAATKHSTMVVESHVRYLREVHIDAPLRITAQLIGYDAKRFHVYEELLHATEGWVSATCETMTVHVDMTAKKVAPFPETVMAAFARMQAAHAALPVPAAVGRRIAMPQKP